MQQKDHNFFADVHAVTQKIPVGRVTSYGAIARYLGSGKSARMVGWALNQSFNKDVPAHRVVNRNGELSGKVHFGSPGRMQQLLEAEGIEVINDQVKNFEQIYWDPSKELQL